MIKVVGVADPQFSELWQRLVEADGLMFPLYCDRNLVYYRTYFDQQFSDLSFVIVADSEPLQGLRVTSHRDAEDTMNLTCYGLPTLHLAQPTLASRRRREVNRLMRATVEGFTDSAHRWRLRHRDFLRFGALSDFSHHLLKSGGHQVSQFTQVIDLSQSEDRLHSELSKSFRWNVSWGKKNLNLRVVEADRIAERDIERFSDLHVEAAGRETRSQATWEAQLEMIRDGEAFAVFAEMAEQLVSAALFSVTKAYCFYGVSASRRALFDKPISHAVLWEAILHAKSYGCQWFETGEQVFQGHGAMPSEKELGINAFKRGFGGQTQVRLAVTLERGFA
jgi:hypothetical protein